MLLPAALAAMVALGPVQPATVTWHDNLHPAGALTGTSLALDLDIVRGMWHPNGGDRAGTSILAFAERGAAPTTPGPLLRVRQGTRVTVSIRNTSDDLLAIHGLASHKGMAVFDSLLVAAGATVTTTFIADVEGTYFYWGAAPGVALGDRLYEGAMLTGALVVDPATGPVADDRILLISVMDEIIQRGETADTAGGILAINGRPWPHTERMQATVGDSIRWRVINASERGHPMHLHGFYFRVDAAGDWQQDTLLGARQRRMTVTENMEAGTTRTIVWSPDRPGGWLFHCHLSFHAMMNPPLGEEWQGGGAYFIPAVFGSPNADADHHVEKHMGGLMMVTQVAPKDGYPIRRPVERTLRLLVVANSDTNVMSRQYGYRLDDGSPFDRDVAAVQPAPVLVLQKDQPTDVVVVNTTDEATSIHWHGIEIESYSDGVVGVGGYAHMPTPAIMPGDSFVARVTVPRSGSFMYHTHVADINQQGKGLAGGIVVVDELATYDASHERVFMAQTALDITARNAIPTAMNRERGELPADTVLAGETYRLRFMNLTLAGAGLSYRFVSDRGGVDWTTVAKDGFELPPWQQERSFHPRHVSIGETVDVLWRVGGPNGSGWLELRGGNGNLQVRQRIEVVAPPYEAALDEAGDQ
jgi:FtsP/CotA-like multicopper oxidase with cupredoxin domain